MFLKHPQAENWVQHTKTGIDNWGQTHDGKSPLLSNQALDRMFLQGDMHLVWDIWAPILDPLPNYETFLSWGQALMESTLTVLSWMITHHFHPGGQDKAAEMSQE
jgi:hypothetical protein